MLAPRRQQDRDDEAQRHHEPDGVDVGEVEGALDRSGDGVEHGGDHGAHHAVHGRLLHREVHREEAVTDDRGAEHQREDHVGGDAHRVDLLGGRDVLGGDEAREVDETAGQADERAEHDERAAVAPERRVDAPVGLHEVAQPVDHEEVEDDDEGQVQRPRGRRPAPVGPDHALHEERRAAEVHEAVDERDRVGRRQRGPVARGGVEEDQHEVVPERRHQQHADVDDDLGEHRGGGIGARAQHERADVPEGHGRGEVGKDPVQPAPRVPQQRKPGEGDVEEERYEREKAMWAQSHSPRARREEGRLCPFCAPPRSRP